VVAAGVGPAAIVNSLVGQGMTVSNITLNCPSNAYGTFSNGNTTNIGLTNGIMLTTGSVTNAIGPNNSPSTGTCNGTSAVDAQLVSLDPQAVNDPCILEFDVVPQCNTLQIRFVFGSEEYPEFVSSGFNDAFGFWVSGPGPACQVGFYNNTNVATLPNNTTIVSIDNVNATTNNAFYVDNTGGATIQYDGFTTVLTRNIALCPCQTYHWKLAIADAGDCFYDSGVFIDFLTCSNALSATTSSSNTTCLGCNGTASVVASGVGPFTYSWSPSGGNSSTASGLCQGTYTCTIDDAIPCSPAYTVAITVGSSGSLTVAPSQTNLTCNGGNNGSATVVPSGGTSPYTYSWSPSGGNGSTASGLAAGTYTCTITDANGCTSTQSFTITEPPALTATAAQTDELCNGGTTGSATVTPTGGTAGYTYSWAPSGGTAATASGLSAGSYTCTVTDANGCVTTQSVTITQPTALACSISVVNSACAGSSATANPTGGVGPYSYLWSNFGSTATQNNLNSGSYTVTVTDANGCVTTQTVSIVSPSVLTAATSWTNIMCFGDSTGNASVLASGGTPGYTYSWAPSGGTNSTASNLTAGTYTCTITDANGCVVTRVFTLTEPPQVTSTSTQTDNLCFGGSAGSVTVTPSGGVPGYTYSWAPSGGTNATASGLAAGTYTCTITDSNGCNSTISVTITQPTALTCSVSVVNAGCQAPGSATATPSGGTGPYAYSWSSGGTAATENNLNAGTYTVTITDANGCVTTQTATITIASPMTATATFTNITCFGNATGTATVTPSGGTAPYTYSWSPSGGNNATANGLSAGTYTCTITDANGCVTTQTVVITQPTQLTATSTQTNVLCNGQTNGTASITAAGGTAGYTYAWTPSGGNASSASGLGAGSYTCTITDANGCTTTQSVTVTQPTPVAVTATSGSTCPGDPLQISANGSGGVGPYTYVWSNGPTTQSQNITTNTTTSYTVTITDANGCTTTAVSTVTANPVPIATITTNAINGVFVVTPGTQLCFDGTAGVSTWSWTLQSGTSNVQSPCVNITAADTGSYCATLIVQNAQGCADTATTCVEITDVFYSIPNVFTPNGDGTNDVFMITNSGMKSLHCTIYDRWGVLIYEWDSTTGYWDGKNKNGNEVVDGVYYWTLNMEDFSGKTYDDHGFVHLIRGK
jgi:gliding motility-associated-like protein